MRAGFDPEWPGQDPDAFRATLLEAGEERRPRAEKERTAGSGDWQVAPGDASGNRPLALADLGFAPRTGPWPDFSNPARRAREFSIVIPFILNVSPTRNVTVGSFPQSPGGADYALVLGSIATNWEIYLNGVVIERALYLDRNGALERPMYLRDWRVGIDPGILREGANLLWIRIQGDPRFALSGLAIGRPQAIGPTALLENNLQRQIELALIVLYLAAGGFHLLFFLLRREERASLYFGAFATILFLYYLCRGPVLHVLTMDMRILLRMELFCLYWVVPCFHFFLDTMVFGRSRRLARLSLIYHSLLSLGALVLPIEAAWDALRLWHISTLGLLLYFLYILLQSFRYEWIKESVRHGALGPVRLMARTLLRTVSGNLLLGYLILGATASYDVLDVVYLHRADLLARYGFFVFIMGSAGMLANRYISAVQQIEKLNEELRFRIVELNQANRGLRDSEERYRTLVEDSHDIIFSLDEHFNFIRANRNIHRILGYSQDSLAGTSFIDLVYVDPEEEPEADGVNSRHLLQAKLDEFAGNRRSIFQKVLFRSNFLAEAKEMHLRLEYVDVHGRPEILGRASSVLEDNLLRFFVSERQRYVIGNSLITAEELSQRLVRNIGKYLDHQRLTGVRFGLREMLVNSIEHGNLNISYDEKTREILSGNYKDFIKARQLDPLFRQRTIQVHYSLSPRRALFLIRDEGAGFDHRAMRSRKMEDLNADLSSHGRGIMMTDNAFDRVRYNERGNQVVLIKYFERF